MLAAGNGLLAQYFDSSGLANAALVRIDPEINFDWGAGSPDSSISNDVAIQSNWNMWKTWQRVGWP